MSLKWELDKDERTDFDQSMEGKARSYCSNVLEAGFYRYFEARHLNR